MVGLRWEWFQLFVVPLVLLSHPVHGTSKNSLRGGVKGQGQGLAHSSHGQALGTGTGIWPGTVHLNKRPSSSQIELDMDMTGRRTRQLSSLTTTNLQAAGTSDYGYGVSGSGSGSEYGNYAQAGSHGGGYGHGGGGGHGGGKKDCNSALGLLGVLGLISFLQNVLRQMTTTAAPAGGGRRKRNSGSGAEPNGNGIDVDQVTRLMMPLLMRVAQVKDGMIEPKCVLPETCRANAILVKELGSEGRHLGTLLTGSIARMIKDVYVNTRSGRAVEDIDLAGRTGRSGDDCSLLYSECLNIPPTHSSLHNYLLDNTQSP